VEKGEKTWTYQYGGNTIIVKNTWFGGCELIVNGQLQDKKTGVTDSDDLRGKLNNGEEIKASLGGALTVKCTLFIDNKLQTPLPK